MTNPTSNQRIAFVLRQIRRDAPASQVVRLNSADAILLANHIEALSGDSSAPKRHSRDCDCHDCRYAKKHPQIPHHALCGCWSCTGPSVETKAQCPVCLGERRVTIGRRAIGQDSRVDALQMMYIDEACPMCSAQETKPESHYCIDCNEAHDPKTYGALKESHHSQQLTSSSTSVGNDVKAEPHRHTDDCWEPDSGCDMGRNEKFAEKASAEHHPFPLTITPIPKKTIARCRCGAHDWPTGIVQIEDSCGRLHTLRGCQSEVVQKAGEEP